MFFAFTIVPDNGEPFDIEAGMRDLRMWEKTHKSRSLGMISDRAAVSATIMFEIAYAACKRQGRIDPTMTGDQFADTHDLELGDDELAAAAAGRADPTSPAA